MISNDTNINTCDNITATSKDMVVSDENSNSSCSTTIPTTIIKTTSTIVNQINNDNKNSRDLMLKHGGDSFTCDISLMSCYSSLDEENDDDSENEQKRQKQQPQEEEEGDEGVEEDDGDEEIYYESTNENDRDFQQENIAPERSDTESEVDDCGLSKLYLNDIEINDKEEEQTITELVNVTEKDKLMQVEQNKSMRVAFGIILRLIFPLANGVVQGIKGIRDVRFLRVLRNIASSRQALTNLFAFAANTISMNLSSVQVTHRIEPILKLLKIRKSRDGIESLPDSPSITETLTPSGTPNPTSPTFSPFCREPRYSLPNFQTNGRKISFEEQVAEKCCTINILAEPPPGEPIRADIVFIHGLHGSLVNTWRQGLWENERRPVEFERPPKPDVRPPKRPRNSRSTVAQPLHHQKRARFGHNDVHQKHSKEKDSIDEAEDNSYSFICGEPKDIQVCDDIEYSFPTFRLRLNDNGRLLQAEHDSKQHGAKKQTTENTESENSEKPNDKTDQSKKPKAAKLTRDDPNYSRCWPGDWLPLDCPGVRVIAVNYTTDPHLWRPLWKKKEARSNLIQRSREMAELLIKHRVGYGHPIVWVGHSKGGLFIKQMIVDAWESGRPAAAPFWRSARGVFFYSVPHRGSHLASIKAPLLLRSVELIDIEKNNKYLLDLHRRFAGLYHLGHLKIEVFSFVETALTLMSVLYMRIVGVDSADPGIGDVCGIRLDHREICKPRDRDCILYKQLVNMINKVC